MAVFSGQKTVTTAGTEVKLSDDQAINGPLMVKALAGNTGKVYLGNADGAVGATSGLELSAGESVIISWVGNLNRILVDASVNGEGVCWLALQI